MADNENNKVNNDKRPKPSKIINVTKPKASTSTINT